MGRVAEPVRILFVDDEIEKVEGVAATLREALGIECVVVTTVSAAIAEIHRAPVDLVVADVFLPLGSDPGAAIGPRARRHREHLEDLGGLVLLDEIDRLDPVPRLLAHTACTEVALLELLGERCEARVPKPAPMEVLLQAVLTVVRSVP